MGNTSQPVITFCIYVLVTLMKGWLLEVQHILGGLKCCSSVGGTVFYMCCSWATSRILCYFHTAFSHSSLSCFQVLSSLKSVARPSSQGCSQGEWYTWLWLPLCFQVIFLCSGMTWHFLPLPRSWERQRNWLEGAGNNEKASCIRMCLCNTRKLQGEHTMELAAFSFCDSAAWNCCPVEVRYWI